MTKAPSADQPIALTRPQRHLYAAGHFGISFMGYVITQWVMKFYFPNSPEATNLAPALLAPWIMVIGRVTDGINDPLVGYLSDSLRTRWGRRKPLMLVALPLMSVLFVLLWYPPTDIESAANFWFSAIVLAVFFAGFTLYAGPYLALLPEIARKSEDRVQLAALQGIYNVFGLIAGGFITGFALGAGLGYQGMAWLVMAISLVAYALPLFGPKDDPRRVADQETPPFIQSVLMTLRNGPFRIYVFSKLLFLLGLLLLVAALPYMVETLLGAPEAEAGIITGIALLVGVLCVPVILRIAARRGVPGGYRFSMVWFAVSASLLALMGTFGPHPWGVWGARALVAVSGIAVAGLYALPYAVLADVTDHDRRQTGIERQAMFFCVQGLILKVAYSTAPFTVTGLLVLFPAHNAIVLTLIGPLTGLLALAGYVVFRFYPEDEVREAVAEVRAGQDACPAR